MSKTFSAVEILLNAVSLVDQAVDPSAGGGVARAIGSFYLRSGTGQAWLKTGAAATAWEKLIQSFAWYSVKDYGALGDGNTEDTLKIQAAIDACSAAGGGVVYVPAGTYRVNPLTMTGSANVQIQGVGPASVFQWSATAVGAGSLLTISGGAQRLRFSHLSFNGDGRFFQTTSNHLVEVGTGTGAVTEVQFFQCQFTGMRAGSGDGIHIKGAAGNLVSRVWIDDCNFNGCARYGIGGEQGFEYIWITGNYFTACGSDIALVATANVTANAVTIMGNEIIHTGSVRHAVRIEGNPTGLYTKVIFADNVVLSGFAMITGVQYAQVQGNIMTSGVYASSAAVLRLYGAVSDTLVLGNIINRATGASAGPLITVEKSTTSPIRFRVAHNLLINEVATAGFLVLVDVTIFSIADNLCRSTNAGASTIDAVDVQAASVAITDALIGPGNQFTAAAGTFRSAVRLVAKGANITNVSIVGNMADQIAYGGRFEVETSGTFNGQLLFGGNNWDATTGDFLNVGVTVIPRIGFNAGTFGANLFTGNGSPEDVVVAQPGSMYLNRSGGQAASVFYKEVLNTPTGNTSTGWIAMGGSMITFGAADAGTAATGLYLAPGYKSAALTSVPIKINITRPGTIRNLRLNVVGAGTTFATNTYTVQKDGVDTFLLATIPNDAAGVAKNVLDSFKVDAGNVLSIKLTKSNIVTAGQTNIIASVELV